MLYLASQSPRRAALLRRLGVDFIPLPVDVPELPGRDEPAEAYVQRVALDKAMAGVKAVAGVPGARVLAADTEVVLEGEVFGKPRDLADAGAMLRRLSGQAHQVVSVVRVADAQRSLQAVSRTEVRFAQLDEADIAAYLATGEAMGKAGAYGIQGAAERFVTHLAGSYSGVMGLPLFETAELLKAFGVSVAGVPASHPALADGTGMEGAVREPQGRPVDAASDCLGNPNPYV